MDNTMKRTRQYARENSRTPDELYTGHHLSH
jgi:hypothetical protein